MSAGSGLVKPRGLNNDDELTGKRLNGVLMQCVLNAQPLEVINLHVQSFSPFLKPDIEKQMVCEW